ncbi:MAG: glycosyltransferase family 2 protein [Proteobacteria bacterium]|nr:glycosyltransferase family 2 protein [Pseudomonadota bacterium]
MKFSIVIPVYGSEKILAESYAAFTRAINAVTDDYEIIFRVDGSPDNSEALLNGIAKKDKHVKVFVHRPNKGLGATLRKLFEDAQGEYVIYFDADSFLCFDLTFLQSMIDKVSDTDAVIVSRYFFNPLLPFHRWVASEAYYWLNKILFGIEIRDIGSGFVIFRKAALNKITLRSEGFEIHSEIFVKLSKAGCKLKEVPLAYKHWSGGSFRFLKHGPKAVVATFRLWMEMRRA